MSGISQEGTNYPATYDDYVPPGAVARALIDIFNLVYPVGSYYETTDTNFDPNVQFGGTWELEAEGLVHISSGANYTVSDQDQDGGETKHTHDYGIQFGGFYYDTTWEADSNAGLLSYDINNDITLNSNKSNVGSVNTTVNGGNATSSKTATAAHYRVTSNTSYTSNMQPYKIVNRWHRTA